MAEFVNEDHCVVDTDLIFPNVQTCFALVVRSTTSMLGGHHAVISTTATEFETAARYMIPYLAGGVDSIYIVGNLSGRTSAIKDPSTAFPGPLKTVLAKAFNYGGTLFYFDVGTKMIANEKGIAVVARRSSADASLELGFVKPGGWSYTSGAAPAANMFKVRQSDTESFSKVTVTQPSSRANAKVGSCQITGTIDKIALHLMGQA